MHDMEGTFQRDFDRDRRLWRRLDAAAWVVSIGTTLLFLLLVMPLGRISPWLLLLNLYSVFTRLSTWVAWKAVLFPPFLLRLDDEDPGVAEAARSVLDRNRSAIVRPILVDCLRASDPAAVAATTCQELAALAREHGIERRRTFARRWFLAWAAVSLALWGTVVATGAGPTETSRLAPRPSAARR